MGRRFVFAILAFGAGITALPLRAQAPALPADTRVEIEFLATLSSATSHAGDVFPIRLAQPIMRRGAVLVPAGALGLGEVVDAKPARGGGAPGVLLLVARYLEFNGRQIPLRALRQNAVGRDRVGELNRSSAISLITVLPNTALGMATHGGDVLVPKGSHALAQVAQDVALSDDAPPPSARATPDEADADDDEPNQTLTELPEDAALSVAAPPPGYGQVVFYRPGTINWKAIGCTVKEDGRKVSSLGSGRWFAYVARPGIHPFRVTGETSDTLRLNVEEGTTQYVSCRMRASILIARPFIRPEPSRDFHALLTTLRLVDDDDMGPPAPEGQTLRRAELRHALAERGDVRGQPYANRAVEDNGFIDRLDPTSRRLITKGLRKAAREAGAR